MASVHKRHTSGGAVRWDVRYRDPHRKDRSRSFARKVDADRFAASVTTDIHRGDWTDPALGRQTFGEWADGWLPTIGALKPKTREGYESVLRHHLRPTFDRTPVARIDYTTVSAFLAELTAKGARAGTVGHVRAVLSLILDHARRSGAIRSNPVADTKAPSRPPAEMLFLTPGQIIALADEASYPVVTYRGGKQRRIHTPERGLLIRTAGFTGMRAGEITALRVGAIELVRRQIRVVASASEAYGELQFGPPKTWRRRSVPVPGALIDDLAVHIDGRAPDEFVFASSKNTPVRHSNFYTRHFKPAAQRAGLPDGLRFHDLRHSYAAILIDQGAHPRAIMERLGHSSIQVTLNTYGHLFPELEAYLTDRLDDIYRQAHEQRPPDDLGLDL